MKINNPAWQNEMVNYIGEYTRKNPGYSPQALVSNLENKFYINTEDAEKLVSFIENELTR